MRHPYPGSREETALHTDIPLKVLAERCAPDLLTLLGVEGCTVERVETLEMPMTSVALDNLLHLRDASGQRYLHLLEWQGYPDALILWRTLLYLSWLGLHRAERPLAATIVYLTPQADAGEALAQEVAGPGGWAVRLHVVRLWQQEAAAAVASGRTGLAVLSPLMHGADAPLVEAAARVVLTDDAPGGRVDDLLAILGVFAEPLMAAEQFVRLVGRERIVESAFLDYILEERVKEKVATVEAQARVATATAVAAQAEMAAERERSMAEMAAERERSMLVNLVIDAIGVRFPEAPFALVAQIQAIRESERLVALHHAVLHAPAHADIAAVVNSA